MRFLQVAPENKADYLRFARHQKISLGTQKVRKMAVLDSTRIHTPAAGFGAHLWEATMHVLTVLFAVRSPARAITTLTEEELDDLGLCRADIIDMQRARRWF